MKMKLLVLAAFAANSAMAANACPDYNEWGTRYSYSSDDLWTERRLSVVAGGSYNLSNCRSVPGRGYVISSPDISIAYRRTRDYTIRFIVEGDCDTVLLVNDANGDWHFDDDSIGTNPVVRLPNAADGKIDVWVGTYGTRTCNATLRIETFP